VIAAAKFAKVPRELNAISGDIVDCAYKIHSTLGPGLLESSYRICLAHELTKRGHRVQQEIELPIVFDGLKLTSGYRIDLQVDDEVIVELKAVESVLAIHKAQLLSYLKHSEKRLGLLINFNVVLIKDGIHRLIRD
jgi:GxxExxY protein